MKKFYELDFDEVVGIGKKIVEIDKLISNDIHISADLQKSAIAVTRDAIKLAYDISDGTLNKCAREWRDYKDTRRKIFMTRQKQWIKKTTKNV